MPAAQVKAAPGVKNYCSSPVRSEEGPRTGKWGAGGQRLTLRPRTCITETLQVT